jgi:hypothetical protein
VSLVLVIFKLCLNFLTKNQLGYQKIPKHRFPLNLSTRGRAILSSDRQTEGQAEGQAGIVKLIVAFCNFAKTQLYLLMLNTP